LVAERQLFLLFGYLYAARFRVLWFQLQVILANQSPVLGISVGL